MASRKKVANGPVRRDPIAALRMSDMVIFKPVLPAEIIARIVDYLAAPDLIRFARVSRKMHEMIYDDSRWIQLLRRMGVWNEGEARKRLEALHTQRSSEPRRKSTIDRTIVNGKGRPENPRINVKTADGFDTVSFSSVQPSQAASSHLTALDVLKRVKSIRGQARQQFGIIYQLLGPYYADALRATHPNTTLIFKHYTLPDERATILANVRILSRSDLSPGGLERETWLSNLISILDTQALLEFRQGYEYKDIKGRMRQHAIVMHVLSGGQSSVDLFLNDNRLLARKADFGSVTDCVDYSLGHGQLSLERVQAHFEKLGDAYRQEANIIKLVFPQATEVSLLFLERIGDEILAPFLITLFRDARTRSTSVYLRVVSGSLQATSSFVQEFALPENADEDVITRASTVLVRLFAPHLQAYLDEELAFFKQKADSEVERWDRSLSEQASSTEAFLMSNVNRTADKKDFMSSFKKVVMMPVNILPSFSKASTSNKSADRNSIVANSRVPSPAPRPFTPTLPTEAPTDELAAKAALMTSRLENIKSLFSIDVALNLIHAAKSSLERAAQFIRLGGQSGALARSSCSSIFVILLTTVGDNHVKTGFDKAIEHLGAYNPRNDPTANHSGPTVAPLTMFLELVNVGDLIQQMLDVFFEEEIVGMHICQRDDFLAAPVKQKKNFEAILDERVAEGLGKGIDVLMDEVEFLCATEQSPTDFNPTVQVFDASDEKFNKRMSMLANTGVGDIDVSPTKPCLHIIDIIDRHVGMLVGSTDKSLIDVFVQEVAQRLFQCLVKHIKRQRVSPLGAIRLLSDLSQYSAHVASYRNPHLNTYFNALREVGQIYLFEGKTEKEIDEMAGIIADAERYRGVFTVEEVVEFAERRSDWLTIKGKVESRVMGEKCIVM